MMLLCTIRLVSDEAALGRDWQAHDRGRTRDRGVPQYSIFRGMLRLVAQLVNGIDLLWKPPAPRNVRTANSG